MRVMIVEDEQRARRGLHNLLTNISDEVDIVAEVSDGRKALELVTLVRPEVIFTDIRMPYMDGIALIKGVKALELEVHFVIVSAYEDFQTAKAAISSGVTEFLVKPVTYEETEAVLEKLKALIEKKPVAVSRGLRKKYPDAHPAVLKALHIIECNYATKISQRELAEKQGMTQEYFSYLFTRDVGKPFSRFLKNYRIEVAKKLLLEDEVPKENVPYAIGFSDGKYFNKVFKETTGESVAEFVRSRKNYF